jgi:hypothetical protein
MTPEHIKIMRHALGLDHLGRGASYRNHFVTGPDTTDWPMCQELVEKGMMRMQAVRGEWLIGGDGNRVFSVTEDGARIARERHEFDVEPKKETISQQRYRSFLRSDNGMTFGEWLKAQKQ